MRSTTSSCGRGEPAQAALAPTVQVATSTLASGYVEDYALVLTGTFVSILPLLIVFLVLGRQIISGIMKGAVKG